MEEIIIFLIINLLIFFNIGFYPPLSWFTSPPLVGVVNIHPYNNTNALVSLFRMFNVLHNIRLHD